MGPVNSRPSWALQGRVVLEDRNTSVSSEAAMHPPNQRLFKKSSHPSHSGGRSRQGSSAYEHSDTHGVAAAELVPKVVVIDIDGTITDGKNTSPPRPSRPFGNWRSRHSRGTRNRKRPSSHLRLWRFLGLSAPMCCENGGVIWHPSWDEPMLRATAAEAKEAARWLADEIDGLDPNGIATNRWRESEWCLFPYENLETVTAAMATSPWPHLSVVRTGFAIHLMEPHLSKGEGLKVLFDRMGWSVDDALCVGDAPNDLPMFDLLHWSVAVGGAFDAVAQASDLVSPHPHGATFPPLVDAILARRTGDEA